MIYGFDVISDLNLTPNDEFNWEGKPTSLFCIVAGNITNDMTVLHKTLKHLSGLYHGVFFIDGTLENQGVLDRDQHSEQIGRICGSFRNVIYLHNNVVVVDGIALLGLNGWSNKKMENSILDDFHLKCFRYDDIGYLEKTLEKLQLHVDVKKVVIISSCVPLRELYFGENDVNDEDIFPGYVLYKDTEHKVTKWIYGTYDKFVDTTINNINYVNNAKYDVEPYFAKRIEIIL